ncbi:MAG: phosphatase PAP2 family protein [Steroidobacteraceae bacterium]|nr:phosphatase PAP2 family protein [Steroidobacteraceae bacterium]
MTEAHRRYLSTLQAASAAALARFGKYLERRRTRTIFASFLASSLLLAAFSGIDISISGMFFDHGFHLASQRWANLLHDSVRDFIVLATVSVAGIYVFNRVTRRKLFAVDGRKVAYLLLVLVLGAGLIVNVALKDNFGRARPRDIAEFGGSEQFTPAFVISDACDHNCSFSSGDSAGAFFALAFVLTATRKRAVSTVGVGFGVLVSAARIATGAHFFSDTVVSFFVMLIVADFLQFHMLGPDPEPLAHKPAAETGILIGAAGKSLP